jgi:hypothetical protein
MSEIAPIHTDSGDTIYVESEDVEIHMHPVTCNSGDLPVGAEKITAIDTAIDTMQRLSNTLSGVFSSIKEGLEANQPDEWTAELKIDFKGKVNPIPVIVGAESGAAITIHARWIKKSA